MNGGQVAHGFCGARVGFEVLAEEGLRAGEIARFKSLPAGGEKVLSSGRVQQQSQDPKPDHGEQYGTVFFDDKLIGLFGRFEKLDNDWPGIAMNIGVSPELPHWNIAGYGSYVEHYDEESKRIVGELYHREIRAFGYEFGK